MKVRMVTWAFGGENSLETGHFEADLGRGEEVGYKFEEGTGRLRLWKNTNECNTTLIIPADDLKKLNVEEVNRSG